VTAELVQWDISVHSEPHAKLAAAYELPWWMLGLTRRALDPAASAPLATCLSRVSGRARQGPLLGRKPYRKQVFSYAASDEDRATAAHALHWLRVSLGMWRSELPSYASKYLVQFGALPDPIEEASTSDCSQRPCGLCAMLLPSTTHEQALLARIDAQPSFQAANDVGLWIASLQAPSASLLHGLLARLPVLCADPTAAYAGQYRPTKALALVAQRVPSTAAFMRAGRDSSEPWARAVALAAGRVEAAAGRESLDSLARDVERALEGSPCESLEALTLLRAARIDDRDRWSGAVVQLLRRMQDTAFPNSQVVAVAFTTLVWMYRDSPVPAEVRAEAEAFLARVSPSHLAASAARKVLAHEMPSSP
jgi:hypothetical protein